jgi:hypothetical protein
MKKASQTQEDIWRIVRWAAQRAKRIKQTVFILTLKRDAREAHTPREKIEILK